MDITNILERIRNKSNNSDYSDMPLEIKTLLTYSDKCQTTNIFFSYKEFWRIVSNNINYMMDESIIQSDNIHDVVRNIGYDKISPYNINILHEYFDEDTIIDFSKFDETDLICFLKNNIIKKNEKKTYSYILDIENFPFDKINVELRIKDIETYVLYEYWDIFDLNSYLGCIDFDYYLRILIHGENPIDIDRLEKLYDIDSSIVLNNIADSGDIAYILYKCNYFIQHFKYTEDKENVINDRIMHFVSNSLINNKFDIEMKTLLYFTKKLKNVYLCTSAIKMLLINIYKNKLISDKDKEEICVFFLEKIENDKNISSSNVFNSLFTDKYAASYLLNNLPLGLIKRYIGIDNLYVPYKYRKAQDIYTLRYSIFKNNSSFLKRLFFTNKGVEKNYLAY